MYATFKLNLYHMWVFCRISLIIYEGQGTQRLEREVTEEYVLKR